MKIAVDISPIQYVYTGVARYTENLFLHLLEIDKNNKYTFFYNSYGNRIKNLPVYEVLKNFSNLEIKEFRFPEIVLHKLWNDWEVLPIELLIGKQDLFYYSDWFCPPFKSRKITTVHDLVFRKYPETVDPYILKTQEQRFRFIKKHGVEIVTDSDASKNDLVELENIKEKNISVVYPGILTKEQSADFRYTTLKKYKLAKPFILTVGKVEPRKNYLRLTNAFSKLNTNIELVIVGQKGWDRIGTKDKVHLLEKVSDSELFALYQEALFFIYPSLYEGFGFPLLEAMSLSCPTACSGSGSLKELGENASLLFNSQSEDDMILAMKKMINDESLRKDLIKRGTQKTRQFSWKKTATLVLKIINNVY